MKRLLLLLLVIALPAQAAPQITQLLTSTGKVGGIVLIKGQGFGTDRAKVDVRFGAAKAKVVRVSDDSLAVQVPKESQKETLITVKLGEETSNGVKFTCQPSVVIEVGKNPLPIGENTTGTIRVYHSEEPTNVKFWNESTAVVSFLGGDEQTVKTCGGPNNIHQFQVVGKAGPRLYTVGYEWGMTTRETVEWNLPWNKVDTTARHQGPVVAPPPNGNNPWKNIDLTRKN